MLVIATRLTVDLIDAGVVVALDDEFYQGYRLELITDPNELVPDLLIGIYNAQSPPELNFQVFRVAKEPFIHIKGEGRGALLKHSQEGLPKARSLHAMGLRSNKRGLKSPDNRTFRLIEPS